MACLLYDDVELLSKGRVLNELIGQMWMPVQNGKDSLSKILSMGDHDEQP